tara:strand:- start:424 stop:726 length:303 start_codon:yes stop_codon:yes gene_type:complete
MKITRAQLKQIIKEELEAALTGPIREHPHDNTANVPITPAFKELKNVQEKFRTAEDALRAQAEKYDVDSKLLQAYNLAINDLMNAIFSNSAAADLEAQST